MSDNNLEEFWQNLEGMKDCISKIPKDRSGLKVIVFHGVPNPREAIKGIWPLKDKDRWKRLYKVCRPTKWIEKYWY